MLRAGAEQWAAGRGAAYVALASRRAGPFYRALGYAESATFFRKLLPHPEQLLADDTPTARAVTCQQLGGQLGPVEAWVRC